MASDHGSGLHTPADLHTPAGLHTPADFHTPADLHTRIFGLCFPPRPPAGTCPLVLTCSRLLTCQTPLHVHPRGGRRASVLEPAGAINLFHFHTPLHSGMPCPRRLVIKENKKQFSNISIPYSAVSNFHMRLFFWKLGVKNSLCRPECHIFFFLMIGIRCMFFFLLALGVSRLPSPG